MPGSAFRVRLQPMILNPIRCSMKAALEPSTPSPMMQTTTSLAAGWKGSYLPRTRCSHPFWSQPLIASRIVAIALWWTGPPRPQRAGRLLRHHALRRGFKLEGGGEQGAGIVALRAREQLLGSPLLHHLAMAHHD